VPNHRQAFRKAEAVKKTLRWRFSETVDDHRNRHGNDARAITPAACEMMDGWTLLRGEADVTRISPRLRCRLLMIEVEAGGRRGQSSAGGRRSLQSAWPGRAPPGGSEVLTAKTIGARNSYEGEETAFGALGRRLARALCTDAVILTVEIDLPPPNAAAGFLKIGEAWSGSDPEIFSCGGWQPASAVAVLIPGSARNFEKACGGLRKRLLRYCVEIGGALTREHGCGMKNRVDDADVFLSDAEFCADGAACHIQSDWLAESW